MVIIMEDDTPKKNDEIVLKRVCCAKQKDLACHCPAGSVVAR